MLRRFVYSTTFTPIYMEYTDAKKHNNTWEVNNKNDYYLVVCEKVVSDTEKQFVEVY